VRLVPAGLEAVPMAKQALDWLVICIAVALVVLTAAMLG
jgi:hypothetical protein